MSPVPSAASGFGSEDAPAEDGLSSRSGTGTTLHCPHPTLGTDRDRQGPPR